MFEYIKRIRDLMESMSGDNFGQDVMLPPPRQLRENKAFGSQIVSSFMDYASGGMWSMLDRFGSSQYVAGEFGVAPQAAPSSSAPPNTEPSVQPDQPEQFHLKLTEAKKDPSLQTTTASQNIFGDPAKIENPPQTAMRVDPVSRPEVDKAVTQKQVEQVTPEQRPQPSAPSKPTDRAEPEPKKFDNTKVLNFLASRYAVGAGMLLDGIGRSFAGKTQPKTSESPSSFTYDGQKSSQSASPEQPQPSPAQDTRPSHPYRLINHNAPSGDAPNVDSKTQQNVVQTSDLTSAVDTAAEQLLYMLDRIAYRLSSFNQRLAVIESIFDRSE